MMIKNDEWERLQRGGFGGYGVAVLPTASESPLVYACELWVFAMCPALRGSTVSYAGDAHFPKQSLEYSLNFWSQ